MSKYLTKLISLILSLSLILEQSLFAQAIDLSRYLNNPVKPALQSDKFRPLHLRSLGYDNLSQDFKLFLDKGDTKKEDLANKTYLEENTQTLLKYFFIGLSLPNEKFWVNLRPDSPDNILDPDLEKTDIGKVFLEADIHLKKDTARMTSPQTPEGRVYWDKLYKKAGELFGSENITIPTITRPWIVPNEIIIREAPDNAYIYKATLKVMLEEDYLIGRGGSRTAPTPDQYTFSDPRLKELNQYSTQLIKETIIPKLTYAVNTAKRYAPLRQVYYSLILAQWFKQKYGGSGSIRAPGTSAPVNSYIDLIDSGNLANLTSSQPYDKQNYFQQYQQSFKDGEYNLKSTIPTAYGQSVRSYMSGGISLNEVSSAIETIRSNKGRELSAGITKKMLSYEFTAGSSVESYKGRLEAKMVSSALEGKSLAGGGLTLDKVKEIFNSLGQDNKEKILMLIKHIFTLETLARDQAWDVRKAAAISLGQVYAELIRLGKMELSRLETLTRDQAWDVRKAAAISLGQVYAEIIRLGLGAQKDSDIVEKAVSFILTQVPFSFRNISILSQEDSYAEARDYFASLDDFIFYLQIIQAGKISPQSLFFILRNKDYISRNPALTEILRRKSPLELLSDDLYPGNQNEGLSGELLESYKIAESLFVLERYAKETSERYHQRLEAYFRAGYYSGKFYLRYQEAYARHFERVGGIGFNVFSNTDNTTVVVTRFGMFYNKEMTPAQEGYLRAEAVRRKINPAVTIEEDNASDPFAESLNKGYPGHYKGDKAIILANLNMPNNRTIPIYTLKGAIAGEFPSRQIRINGKAIEVKFLGIDRNFSRVIYAVEDEVISICLDITTSNRLLEEGKEFYRAWVENMPESLFSIYTSLMEKDKNKAVAAIALDFAPRGVYGHSPAIMVLAQLIEKGISKPEGAVNAEGFLRGSSSSPMDSPSASSAVENNGVASPAIDNKGGIAFNSLPIQTESVASSALGALSGGRAFKGDLDAEWVRIQAVFNAGVRPSILRLSEYTAAAAASPMAEDKIDQVRVMLADILRRDEGSERSAPAEEACKQLLRALEAGYK